MLQGWTVATGARLRWASRAAAVDQSADVDRAGARQARARPVADARRDGRDGSHSGRNGGRRSWNMASSDLAREAYRRDRRAGRTRRAGSAGSGSTPAARAIPRRAPRRRRSGDASLDRPRAERDVVAVLRPHGLPELVVVAPGRDEEEVEALPAAVQDHEAEIAGERECSRLGAAASSRGRARESASGTGASPGAMSYHLRVMSPSVGLLGETTFACARSRAGQRTVRARSSRASRR